MPDMSPVIRTIDDELPRIAREVIERHLDLNLPANRAFLDDPDERSHHQTQWHQWGIITHTRTFLRYFDTVIPDLLHQWGLWGSIDPLLQQTIDGATRWQLLHVSILLHDVGKFGARTQDKRGQFHFWRHERLSGAIVRKELALQRFGLTTSQVEYIARTAEDHFVLGVVRKRAREEGAYDASFTEREAFVQLCQAIRSDHPDDYVEIGILFLGDSLAKADPESGPERAVSQHGINIQVARRYLEIVLGRGSV